MNTTSKLAVLLAEAINVLLVEAAENPRPRHLKMKTLLHVAALALLLGLKLSATAQTELIQNGGFESGSTPWALSSPSVYNLYNYAHSGSYYLWLGGDNGTDTAYQTVTIPADATAAALSFYYNINSSEPSSYGAYDTFTATIRNTGNSVLATIANWSNLNGTSPGNPYYYQQTYNLLPYKGSTIRVYFVSSCHLAGNQTTNFRVDDVSVLVTTGPNTTPTVQTLQATQVTPSSAALNGRVTNNGGATIDKRRFEWARSSGNWSTGAQGVDWGVIYDASISVSGNDFSASLSGLAANTGYKYRVYAHNSAGWSDVNLVNVVTFTTSTSQQPPSITTQPVNRTVLAGDSASFTVAANGNPTPAFQWQRSTDGGANWSNLSNDGTYSGVATSTMTVSGTTAGMSGYQFRAVASNSEGIANSNAATLTVDGGSGVDYPGAIWDPAHPYNYTPAARTASDIRWVVIHTTEDAPGSDCSTSRNWFRSSNNPNSTGDNHLGLSAHYVICRDGTVYQMVRDHDIAHHAGNYSYNERSIGIEHERHDTSNWTEAQFQASASLVKWLATQYNIQIVFPGVPVGIAPADPTTGSGIIGHNQVPDPANPNLPGGANHHTDPVNWDWAYFQQLFDLPPPVLAVSPADGLSSSGNQGGPFDPASKTYAVSNTGGGTLSWTASADQNWVAVTPANGQNPGNVVVSINANANALSVGPHNATVTFGGNGGTVTRQVELTVNNASDTMGSSLTIQSPQDGTPVTTSTVTINGQASDAGYGNSGISGVWVNGQEAKDDTATGADTAKWSYTVTLAQPGANTFTVTAKDNSPAKNQTTKTLNLIYQPPNQPPQVVLTLPSSGQSYTAPATVTLRATASDPDGTVAKVEFFNGATKLGEDVASPYESVWPNVPAGNYTLTAKATDNLGAAKESDPVSITVSEPPQVSATQTAPNYVPGTTLTVAAEFAYPAGRQLLSLRWQPVLPNGWTLASASGDGTPEVNAGEIVFIGLLTANPVRCSIMVTVPSGERGPRDIAGLVEYQLNGMVNPSTIDATPIQTVDLPPYHAADYRDPRWQIDGTEVSRVLTYWRAGGYQVNTAGADGYAVGGGGATGGHRHTADYREPYWVIDGTEVSRVLTYWRAGGYHSEAQGADGYASGIGGVHLAGRVSPHGATTPVVSQNGGAHYTAGSDLQINGSFDYSGGTLLSLLWRPHLPAGWTVVSVNGTGTPEFQMGEVVWVGSLPASPIAMTCTIHVPAGETGVKEIRGEVEYQFAGTVNPETAYATPDPLVLTPSDLQNYALTIIANNGTVTKVPNLTSYSSGAQVLLTATPADGYMFTGWSGAVNDTANPITITMVADKTVTASFTQQGTVVVAANPVAGGTASGDGSYAVGSQQQIKATANPGWTFTTWNDGNTDNPRTVTVAAGTTTYTANFTQQQGTVIVAANPTAGGTASGGGTYAVGSQQQIKATANPGWAFSAWNDGNTDNPRMVTVAAGTTTYTVTFTETPLDIAATHSSDGYIPGGTMTVLCTISFSGQPSTLGWSAQIPPGWSYASGQNEPSVKPTVGQTGTLEWAWQSVPATPVQFSYTLNVPPGESGTRSVAGLLIYRAGGTPVQVAASPDPLNVDVKVLQHSADTDHNWKLSLLELTRVIELYNYRAGTSRTGEYHVESGTEDGYASGPGSQTGAYHSADTDHNWKLNLLELTRVIELYNYRSGTTRTGEYHVEAGTEDGYAPGPGPHGLARLAGNRQGIHLSGNGPVASQTSSVSVYDPAGGEVEVTCRLVFSGSPSALGWQAEIPAGWSYVAGSGEPNIKPEAGQTETLEWAWQTVPASPLEFSYTLRVPPGESGEKLVSALAIYREAGQRTDLVPDPIRLNPGVQQFALIVTTPSNGTVTKAPDLTSYFAGAQVVLTATPADGYVFTGWSGAVNDTANPVTITMDVDKTITAHFTQQEGTLVVAASPTAGGTASGSGTYPVGSQQQMKATAMPGWSFTAWNDGNTDNPRTVTVAAGTTTYTANFTQQQGTVVMVANPSVGGTVSGNGTYAVGSQQQIKATANPGWAFTVWNDGNTDNPRTITVAAGTTTYTANFLPAPPNDNFADGIALNMISVFVRTTGANTNATKEVDEPYHAAKSGGRSVWWTWTPTADAAATVSTAGSSFDTLLGVYTGSSVSELTLVASNDDDPAGGSTSRLTFTAKAATVYHIVVDGAGGASGRILLSIEQATTPPPTITDTSLVGSSFSVAVSTVLGANYTLEYKASLRDADWIATQTLPGTGGTITLTDSAATNPTRFYRVRVQ